MNRELGPCSHFALDRDVAVVAGDDPVGDREPEAGPLDRLSGEERIEDPGLRPGVHAGPGVADSHQQLGIDVLARDRQTPARRHGVDRVQDHVREYLSQLRGVAGDGPPRAQVEASLDRDAALFGPRLPRGAGQLHHAQQHGIDVERLEPLVVPHARELLDAAYGHRSIQRCLFDDAQLTQHLGVRAAALQELGAPENRRKDVVEVVGHAAGHFAESGQLGRLDKLGLSLAQLVIRLLDLFVHARVRDRGAALGREQGRQLEILLYEEPGTDAGQREHAEDPLAGGQRHAQQRRLLLGRARNLDRARIALGHVHDLALAGQRHGARDPLAHLESHPHDFFAERFHVAGHRLEHLVALVEHEHRAFVHLDDGAHLLRDRGEDGPQIQRLDDRLAHGEERGELVAQRFLVIEHVLEWPLEPRGRGIGPQPDQPARDLIVVDQLEPGDHHFLTRAGGQSEPAHLAGAPRSSGLQGLDHAGAVAWVDQVLERSAGDRLGRAVEEQRQGPVPQAHAPARVHEQHRDRHGLEHRAEVFHQRAFDTTRGEWRMGMGWQGSSSQVDADG